MVISVNLAVKIYSLIIELSLFLNMAVTWFRVLFNTMLKSFKPSIFKRLPGFVKLRLMSINSTEKESSKKVLTSVAKVIPATLTVVVPMSAKIGGSVTNS